MEINVAKIKDEILNLDHLINEYENNYLSLYNELFSFSFYWKSPVSERFFDEKQKEKLALSEFIGELNSYKEIYEFIQIHYGLIGEKVLFDVDKLDSTYTKISEFYLSLKRVVDSLTLFGQENPKVLSLLDINLKKFKEELLLFEDFRKKYSEKISLIKEGEKEVRYRLSKINFTKINPSFFVEGGKI